MADEKCIGKLTLDITDVNAKIKEVNEFLGSIGANINLEDKLNKNISKALNKLIEEAKTAGQEAQKALENATKIDTKGGLESTMSRVTTTVRTYAREIDNAGAVTGRLVSTVKSGFDAAGNKVKEFANASGAITKRTEESKNAYEAEIDAAWKVYEESNKAYEKQSAAAVRAGLKREEAAKKAAEAEQQKNDKEVSTMDTDITKRAAAEEAALDKLVAADAAAQEKLRQQSIETEFAREEARKREAEAEAEQIQKDLAMMDESVAQEQAALDKQVQAYYDAEEKKRQASINTEFEREEARQKAAQQEADLISKEVSAMEEDLAKQEEILDKQVQAYEEAEEKKRQASINAEFEREEAREKAAQAEIDLINKEVAAMEEAIQKQQEASQRQFETDQINKAKQAYIELKDAIENYNIAKNNKDQSGMDAAQNRINAAMQEVAAINQTVESTYMEAGAKQQVLNYTQQCATAEAKHNSEINNSTKTSNELTNQINSMLTRYLSIVAVIRTINNLIKNTVEYVSEYSTKMNEIQIITGKSSSEIEQLADTYRNLAADMSVSSLDMADAAIYFTRQGLAAAEVETRLKNTTQYAKTANIEFKTAAELITSVVNSMNLVEQAAEDGRNASQRVADVFMAIGDNAATSGEEIGTAMQKAGAAAGAFGMEFEWLASYIATVSETTRQEATSIGTAFNTLIARLHSIRTTGFNSEDETKINDIQKALANINVTLLDQSGNWRDIVDIFQDVAAQWDTLDGKTKSYIATTMAGVKQQNVFLALMEDLSKAEEGQSRAVELHNIALNSAGTAQEKYAIYTDSVAAAQERLTVAQEKFYSILDDNVIKNWYDGLAKFVDMIAEGAERTNAWSIAIPVLAGVITAVAVAIHGLNIKLGQTVTLITLLEKHPIVMAVSAAIAVIGVLVTMWNALATSTQTAAEKLSEANTVLQESQTRISSFSKTQEDVKKMFDDLGSSTKPTNEQLDKYKGLLDEVSSVSATAKDAVDKLTQNAIDQATAFGIINDELQKYIDHERQLSSIAMMQKLDNTSGSNATNFAYGLMNLGYGTIGTNFDYEAFGEYLNELEYGKETFFAGIHDYGLVEYLEEFILKYESMYDYIEDDSERWKTIGQAIINEILGGMSAEDYIDNEAKSLVDDIMNSIYFGLDETQYDVVRSKLIDAIYGEDGVLDKKEYQQMYQTAKAFIGQTIDTITGVINTEGLISAEDEIRALGEKIFGDYFDQLFGDQLSEIEDKEYLADKLSQAFAEIFAAGFETSDIANILSTMPLSQWDRIADIMRDQMKSALKSAFGVDVLGEIIEDVDLDTGETIVSEGMWDEIDLSVLKLIADMANAGVTLEQINNLMHDSSGVEEFKTKLNELCQEYQIVTEAEDENADATVDYAKALKSAQEEIEDIDKLIAQLKNGKAVKFSDIVDLAGDHQELLTTTNMLETLQKIREETRESQKKTITDMYMDSEDWFAGSLYKQTLPEDSDIKTMRQYIAYLEETGESSDYAKAHISKLVDEFMAYIATIEDSTDATETWLQTQARLAKETSMSNWAKSNKFVEQIGELERALKEGGIQEAVKVWNSYDETMRKSIADTYPNLVIAVNEANETIQKSDQETLDAAQANMKRREELAQEMADLVGQTNVDLTHRPIVGAEKMQQAGWNTGNDTWATLYSSSWDADIGPEEAQKQVSISLTPILSNGEVMTPEAMENYIDYLITDTMDEAGLFEKDRDVANGGKNLLIGLNIDGVELHYLQEEFYELGNAEDDVTEATNGLGTALNKAGKYANAKYFKNTAKAIKDLEEGTISASDAFDIYYGECEKVTKAYDEIVKANKKVSEGTQLTESDVNSLADLLGVSAQQIINDYAGAVATFDQLVAAGGDLESMFNALNSAAFIRITGTSEADFSNLQNGLISVQGMAKETIALLEATGQWKVETMELNTDAWVQEGDVWNLKHLTGSQQILVPTGNNPLAGSSFDTTSLGDTSSSGGGGGGGGGGSSSSSTTTEVEKQLAMMEKMKNLQDTAQSYYQAQQSYYSQTGQLQGVIGYAQREIDVLENQNESLQANIDTIEQLMAEKKAELATMTTADEGYEEIADDLEQLQEAHADYTQQIIDNNTALDELNETIDDTKDAIRQMQIDIRSLVYGAIEDREEKIADMLDAEIEMEDKVFAVIKKRYEDEQELILETTDLKIEALEEEKDLLDEQLELRKKLADEEDKAAELAELEAKYARISADPTRMKEALSIQQEIADLREEIAWDAAEDEVDAQKDALDQQIDSLNDYKDYINDYYEDLFEHPQKLIEETREIMEKTDEEILAFLKANDEEYQAATENRQKQLEQEWQSTLDSMRGKITTYWEEVEEIIAQGDEAIIEFLKENSADYAAAGQLEAEAYVDAWQEQLDDLKKALEEVKTDAAAVYDLIEDAEDEGSGSESGGGGGGGGGGGNGGEDHGYSFVYGGVTYANKGYATKEKAEEAMKNRVESVVRSKAGSGVGSSMIGQGIRAVQQSATVYAKGGLATDTGLAWLDGTKQDPERVLSPYQTELFETMVNALESIGRVSISPMPNYSGAVQDGASQVSVGDIIVQVENLDTDDDYKELAKKVSEVLMEEIGKTAVVGGLRITSF